MSNGPLAAKIPLAAEDWRLRRSGATWLLGSPLWRGDVELKSRDLLSPRAIRVAALDQKAIYLPPAFDAEWLNERVVIDATSGRPRLVREPGLLEKLLQKEETTK
jgi:hypothetical protein